MIIKPSIQWLNTDSDALFINDTSVILLGMANNTSIYATPSPTLPVVQAALDDFSAGVAATADGGPSATSKKTNLRLILAGLLRQLASYVAVACKGDMTNLLLSGFPVQKPVRTPIGALPAPQNLTVTHGMLSGELDAKVNPVFGASTYNWTCTPNTPGAVQQTAQTTASSYAFNGLTPGVSYTITTNAVGAAGPSKWSSPVSQFAD
jgi:hypothetical protein